MTLAQVEKALALAADPAAAPGERANAQQLVFAGVTQLAATVVVPKGTVCQGWFAGAAKDVRWVTASEDYYLSGKALHSVVAGGGLLFRLASMWLIVPLASVRLTS